MEINRLRWGCRRGMLELDLVLEPFLDNVYASISEEDKALFEKFLESEDQDMFGWFLHHKVPEDPETAHVVKLILDNTGLREEDGNGS
ncbi:MAG: succinate dehydrogenase assembly factor 2 [Agarilytica sp.]